MRKMRRWWPSRLFRMNSGSIGSVVIFPSSGCIIWTKLSGKSSSQSIKSASSASTIRNAIVEYSFCRLSLYFGVVLVLVVVVVKVLDTDYCCFVVVRCRVASVFSLLFCATVRSLSKLKNLIKKDKIARPPFSRAVWPACAHNISDSLWKMGR